MLSIMPKTKGRDKVIVIIVSFNGQAYWPDLLPTLVQEKYINFDLEIVVVDNNSNDGSAEYIAANFSEITLLRSPENLGFVGGNNLGYQYALERGAQYIYLLNQDTVISPGFLQPLYDFSRNNIFGSLQSKINLWPDKNRINTTGNIIYFLGFGYGAESGLVDNKNHFIQKIDYASGAGVWLSMDVLKKLGGLFDEKMFMYLEDLDLGWSLSLLGYDNYLIPESQIYHKYDFGRSMKNVYWFERNRLWVAFKNYKIGTLLLLFPAGIIMELGQLFYAAKNHYLWKKLKAYIWLFSPRQWRHFQSQRQKIQSQRQKTDRQLVRNFSGQILFQPLDTNFLRVANIFFNIYWQIVKQLIFW